MNTIRNLDTANALEAFIGITAAEGGINNWAHITRYRWSAPTINATHEKFDVRINLQDTEDDNRAYIVTPNVIRSGIERLRAKPVEGLAEQYRASLIGQTFLAYDDADFDAQDADILVQIGLFGEVRYG